MKDTILSVIRLIATPVLLLSLIHIYNQSLCYNKLLFLIFVQLY